MEKLENDVTVWKSVLKPQFFHLVSVNLIFSPVSKYFHSGYLKLKIFYLVHFQLSALVVAQIMTSVFIRKRVNVLEVGQGADAGVVSRVPTFSSCFIWE